MHSLKCTEMRAHVEKRSVLGWNKSYRVITDLLDLMNSPSLTKNKYIDLLLEYEERVEAKNTSTTRKRQLVTKETDGSIKRKLYLEGMVYAVFV